MRDLLKPADSVKKFFTVNFSYITDLSIIIITDELADMLGFMWTYR